MFKKAVKVTPTVAKPGSKKSSVSSSSGSKLMKSYSLGPTGKLITHPMFSSSKCLQQISVKQINCHTIKVVIYSNWGDPGQISCGELDLLDDNHGLIPILDYTLEPYHTRPVSMKHLWNNKLFKTIENEFWTEIWPPPPPQESITIRMKVPDIYSVDKIRVWPNSFHIDRNIKKVQIQVNDYIVFEGDFPHELGSVFHLSNNNMKMAVPSPANNYIEKDQYGKLPLYSAQEIDIIPISTYGTTQFFGINRIIVFGCDLQQIDGRKNCIVSLINGTAPKKNLNDLFRNITKTKDGYEADMFDSYGGEVTTDLSNGIKIRYGEQKIIAGIMILNPVIEENKSDISVKNCKIVFDGRQVWCGRIKKRILTNHDEKSSGTFIFFTPNNDYHKKMINTLPDRKIIIKEDGYEIFE